MRVHILQHVPFEGPGWIGAWLAGHRARVSTTRFFESAGLPDIEAFDMVIVMGGPMSVHDETEFPWLADEKRFVAAAVRAGKSVLGICLGAQILADALGARVYPNGHKEIGWFDIEGVSTPPGAPAFPKSATVFHWHGETFDLPAGAIHLARSAGCENQAFQVGSKAIGLQFHLEMTPESMNSMLVHCRHELTEGRFIQSEAALRSAGNAMYEGTHPLMDRVLTYLTGNGD